MARPRSESLSPESRFVLSYEEVESGCWEWLKSTVGGYGQFYPSSNRGTRYVYAHRFAWETNFGPIPEGMEVLHKCDNNKCVRPSHLFLGTQQDNLADMRAKGRDNSWGHR